MHYESSFACTITGHLPNSGRYTLSDRDENRQPALPTPHLAGWGTTCRNSLARPRAADFANLTGYLGTQNPFQPCSNSKKETDWQVSRPWGVIAAPLRVTVSPPRLRLWTRILERA